MALSRINRLKREDIKKVFKLGKSAKENILNTRVLKNSSEQNRFAIVLPSRVVKKAALRNKIKRVFSEILKGKTKQMPQGYDIVITLVQGRDTDAKSLATTLDRSLKKLIQHD